MAFPAFALLLASSVPAAPAAPAASAAPFVFGETLRFESVRMGGPREIVVRVPRGGTGLRYPVVYVLDGAEGFLPATAAAGFLAAHLSMPEAIVVGVRHADRGYELTPLPSAAGSVPGVPRPGGADALLAHLADEVFPLVESRYPTQPYRVVVGHSLGGLFAVHALASRPELFQGYVLLDPALWWDGGGVARRLEASFRGHPDARARLVLVESRGVDGAGPPDPGLPGVRFRRVLVDGESHATLAYRGIYEGLRALFSDYPPAYRRDAEAATAASRGLASRTASLWTGATSGSAFSR
jgi:predicted alpha/beta superfamily hydrolase